MTQSIMFRIRENKFDFSLTCPTFVFILASIEVLHELISQQSISSICLHIIHSHQPTAADRPLRSGCSMTSNRGRSHTNPRMHAHSKACTCTRRHTHGRDDHVLLLTFQQTLIHPLGQNCLQRWCADNKTHDCKIRCADLLLWSELILCTTEEKTLS